MRTLRASRKDHVDKHDLNNSVSPLAPLWQEFLLTNTTRMERGRTSSLRFVCSQYHRYSFYLFFAPTSLHLKQQTLNRGIACTTGSSILMSLWDEWSIGRVVSSEQKTQLLVGICRPSVFLRDAEANERKISSWMTEEHGFCFFMHKESRLLLTPLLSMPDRFCVKSMKYRPSHQLFDQELLVNLVFDWLQCHQISTACRHSKPP